MIVLEGFQARVRVVTQGYKVRVRRNGVNIYVPMRAGSVNQYTTLSGTSATFPAGTLIETVTVEPHTAERTILIGTTVGGSQIASEVIAANTPGVIRLDLYATASTTLHFTGSPLVAKIYRALP